MTYSFYYRFLIYYFKLFIRIYISTTHYQPISHTVLLLYTVGVTRRSIIELCRSAWAVDLERSWGRKFEVKERFLSMSEIEEAVKEGRVRIEWNILAIV